ncbi:protein kinase [Streptomyces sp. WAC 00631]|nr:protein kinase [Streptomyces sp. WAC 00631]
MRRALAAAQAAAAVSDHPRYDQVFDVFAEGGGLWIVSELVVGRPLAALLAEHTLSPHRAAEVAADVLTALSALHAQGWIHRNITARTVLVCEDGRAMLTGLASGAAEEALCGYDPTPPPEDGPGGPGGPGAPGGPDGPGGFDGGRGPGVRAVPRASTVVRALPGGGPTALVTTAVPAGRTAVVPAVRPAPRAWRPRPVRAPRVRGVPRTPVPSPVPIHTAPSGDRPRPPPAGPRPPPTWTASGPRTGPAPGQRSGRATPRTRPGPGAGRPYRGHPGRGRGRCRPGVLRLRRRPCRRPRRARHRHRPVGLRTGRARGPRPGGWRGRRPPPRGRTGAGLRPGRPRGPVRRGRQAAPLPCDRRLLGRRPCGGPRPDPAPGPAPGPSAVRPAGAGRQRDRRPRTTGTVRGRRGPRGFPGRGGQRHGGGTGPARSRAPGRRPGPRRARRPRSRSRRARRRRSRLRRTGGLRTGRHRPGPRRARRQHPRSRRPGPHGDRARRPGRCRPRFRGARFRWAPVAGRRARPGVRRDVRTAPGRTARRPRAGGVELARQYGTARAPGRAPGLPRRRTAGRRKAGALRAPPRGRR